MRIARGDVVPYSLPFVRPYVAAGTLRHRRDGFLVRLVAEDGSEGLGEAAPLGARTEALELCRTRLESAIDTLIRERLEPDEALDRLDALFPAPPRTTAARFGLCLALSDLAARRDGVPLARYLAQRWNPGARVPRHVPVNATIPSYDGADTVRQAEAAVRAGFTCLKLKVGHDPGTDVARVAAVRDAVGPRVALRLDANQGWTLEEAPGLLEALAPLGIQYVEQPIAEADLDGLAALRRSSPIPIAADEPVRNLATARLILALGAADVLVLKPMVLGGPDKAIEIASMAESQGVKVVVTCTIDGAVARAGALHTAACLGPRELACGLATASLLSGDVAPANERISHGLMEVPDAPGHGIRSPAMREA